LVIGFIATVGNYDYCYHWIFRQDASIEFVAELTGILLTKGVNATQCQVCKDHRGEAGVVEPAGDERYGTLVAPNILGVNHQHFMNIRLDFDIDGVENSVKEINVQAAPVNETNPFGNAFTASQTVFSRERAAMRDVNLASHRCWAVFNPNVTTALGHNPAYVLEPGANTWPYLPGDGVVRRFTGFADHHFFATHFHPEELNAAGPYPAHVEKPDSVATWSDDDESILNQDVVAWYTFGLTHVPRPEDFPVMPTVRAGFKLVPKGFFNRNPALDVSPPPQP
jgi:primary-amine oxidase